MSAELIDDLFKDAATRSNMAEKNDEKELHTIYLLRLAASAIAELRAELDAAKRALADGEAIWEQYIENVRIKYGVENLVNFLGSVESHKPLFLVALAAKSPLG